MRQGIHKIHTMQLHFLRVDMAIIWRADMKRQLTAIQRHSRMIFKIRMEKIDAYAVTCEKLCNGAGDGGFPKEAGILRERRRMQEKVFCSGK